MNTSKKINYDILIFILVPLAFFFAMDIPFVFFNNDDFFLKQIASGELTGTPETHLLHIGYFTGVILSILYRILPGVPWYGILLFSYGYLSIILPIYFFSQYIEKKLSRIICSVLCVGIALSFLSIHLISIQYTTITGIVCASSLAFFYLAEETEDTKTYLKNTIPGFITFFLALELRNKACIMFLPMYFFLILSKYLKNRKLFKPLFSYAVLLFILLMISFGAEKIAYSSHDWNDFKTYNTTRENIVDYTVFPDYDRHSETYEELGISYQSYVAANSHYLLLLDDNINAGSLQALEKLLPGPSVNIKDMCKSLWERHIHSHMDRPLNLIVYLVYFFTVIFILISEKKKLLWDVLAILGGRSVIWIYLAYIGRSLPRVTQGIYVAELLMLLSIIFGNRLWCIKSRKKKILQYALCSALIISLLCATIKWGIPNTRITIGNSQAMLSHSNMYQEIRLYFAENNENLYLLDTLSFSYFTENIFEETSVSHNNFVSLGGWPANSPWTDSVLEQYGYDSYEQAVLEGNNVFFVFMNTKEASYDYLNDYFNEKHPGTFLTITDTFQCSNGVEFFILQLQSE